MNKCTENVGGVCLPQGYKTPECSEMQSINEEVE